MDWQAVVANLADDTSIPLAITGPDGRVLLYNGQLEKLLGVPHDEAVGSSAAALFPPLGGEVDERWILDALEGGQDGMRELDVLARCGLRLGLRVELKVIGTGEAAGLAILVRHARTVPERASHVHYIDYEMSLGEDFGRVMKVNAQDEGLSGRLEEGERCFAKLGMRSAPCALCPLGADSPGTWPRSAVCLADDGSDAYDVVTAERTSPTSARILRRRLTHTTLAQVWRSRLQDLARDSGLSPRERDVLEHLVKGHDSTVIASALGITRRTVKFHQANTLQKLGVRSRFDLVRLVAFA